MAGVEGGWVAFADDLEATLAEAQATLQRLLARIDPCADAVGAPPENLTTQPIRLPPAPRSLDLAGERIRTVLDAALVDAARAAGADVRHGMTLLSLVRRDDGGVTGAVLQAADGAQVLVQAGMVVGADGNASSVARLAGAPVLRSGMHACGVVFGYFPNFGLEGYRWCYNPGSSAGFIATNGGQLCVFAAMPPARLRGYGHEGKAAAFRAVLAVSAPELAPAFARLEPDQWRLFAGVKGFMRRPHGPGWALVGDAGYFRDPSRRMASPKRCGMPSCWPMRWRAAAKRRWPAMRRCVTSWRCRCSR